MEVRRRIIVRTHANRPHIGKIRRVLIHKRGRRRRFRSLCAPHGLCFPSPVTCSSKGKTRMAGHVWLRSQLASGDIHWVDGRSNWTYERNTEVELLLVAKRRYRPLATTVSFTSMLLRGVRGTMEQDDDSGGQVEAEWSEIGRESRADRMSKSPTH
jgi:hypothetical protein